MPYLFRGFFAPYAEGLMEAAAQRWPGASVVRIHAPLDGIGLRLPIADPNDPPQYIMVVECEDEFPAWTTRFPDLKFVFVVADCFGGDCEYRGYLCKNGEKITHEQGEDGTGALARLLSHLGATLDEGEYFPPFRRDYPW